jgi:hypothetical protein
VIDEGGAPFKLYRFKVVEAFKGIPTGTTEIFVNPSSMTSCAISFEAGRDYLFFTDGNSRFTDFLGDMSEAGPIPVAWRSLGNSSVYNVGTCSPVRIVEENDPELVYLRSRPSGDGWIEGRAVQNYSRYSFDEIPARDGVLTARSSSGIEQSVAVDSDGRFRLGPVAPGLYSMSLKSPTLGVARMLSAPAVPAGGCSIALGSFETNSTISGRVIGPDGKPAAGVRVEVGELRAGSKPHVVPQTWANTDKEGRFEVSNVPVAQVVLAANLNGAPDTRMPFDPVYAPGVQRISEARVFNLAANSHVKDVVIPLPAPLEFGNLYVDVLWPDGSPAKDGARATAEYDGSRADFQSALETTNRVKLSLALGRTYDVEADWFHWAVDERAFSVDGLVPVKVKFTKDGQVVQLRLKESRPTK